MMHGSVIDICKNLADDFGPEESVAVLVWTKADVMDCGECMKITEDEAGRVLSAIGDEGYHFEYGVGQDRVREMLNNLRDEEELAREVSVSAAALEQVLRVAWGFMRLEDAQGGEGYAASLWQSEHEALRKVGEALKR